MTTGFVERLAAARIGGTYNQYAGSALRRLRLAPTCRATPGDAPRRRGARLPRRAHLRDPAHLGAPADRHGAGGGDGDDRLPRSPSSGSRTTFSSGTSCPPTRDEQLESAADARRDRGRRTVPAELARAAACSRSAARARGSAARTSAIRLTAARRVPCRPPRGAGVGCGDGAASRSAATRSCSRRR